MDTEHELVEETLETEEESPESTGLLPPVFRHDLNVNYLGGLFIASIALFAVGALGLLSWWVALPTVLVLTTTLFDGWQLVTRVGAAILGGVLLLWFMMSISATPEPEVSAPTPTLPAPDPFPPIEGSLGIYVDQVTELWNTVDGPPRIQRGLTHQTEPGEYDAFIYRFGEWGRLIGAYDDDSEALYGLLATGQFSGSATDQLYIHLCFVVAPYSQECLAAYQEQGLQGDSLEDFIDLPHQAAWTVGEHNWHLEIDQNVLSLRVYGADVP